jgi:pimeloyl-ACP methyl ester carboxylesterase
MFVEKSVQCINPGGTHEIVYSEFPGNPDKTVICVHGLSRNGRDFDWLATALAIAGYRVLCPDMAGRGRSKKFDNPSYYNYPQYMSDLMTLMTETGTVKADWVGTSMGGLIGMMIAAHPSNPIKKLVINDIGPYISAEALERIKKYVSLNPTYHDWEGFYEAFKKRMAPFGIKDEAAWDFFAHISAEKNDKGGYRMNYDTNIVEALVGQEPIKPVDLWPLWDMIRNEMLILHGNDSDVLLPDTLHTMMVGKKATSVSFANVGHAPALLSADQISVIKDFLIS